MRYHDRSSNHGLSWSARSAFTLVDMVVAILVLGLIAAISVPRLGTVLSESRARSAAAVLAADLEYLRDSAIATGREIVFTMDANLCTVTAPDVSSAVRTHESYQRDFFTEFGIERWTLSDDIGGKLKVDRFGRFWDGDNRLSDWQIDLRVGSVAEQIQITPVQILVGESL